jgi:hypothetical protein
MERRHTIHASPGPGPQGPEALSSDDLRQSERLQHGVKSIPYPPFGIIISRKGCDRVTQAVDADYGDGQRVQGITASVDNKYWRNARMLTVQSGHRLPHNQWRNDSGGHTMEIVGLEDDDKRPGGTASRAPMDAELSSPGHRLCISSDRLPCCL